MFSIFKSLSYGLTLFLSITFVIVSVLSYLIIGQSSNAHLVYMLLPTLLYAVAIWLSIGAIEKSGSTSNKTTATVILVLESIFAVGFIVLMLLLFSVAQGLKGSCLGC